MSDSDFVKATPESLGFSSCRVDKFISIIEENDVNLHSFMMIRNGKIGAEGYWKPFHGNQLHRMYSVSKTFVSAAVGLLADEGKISLSDKVIKYFPDKLPKGELHPYVAQMTIKDLLIMATPYDTVTYGLQYNDWAWTFFNTPPTHPPGTVFCYDTSGSYILDVIVERVTGKPFLEYMKEKMLSEIGFSENAWCVKAPEGYSWGGSGVMATTRDLAKFASVFLNGGKYNGKQFISEEYVKEATTKQIDNNSDSKNCPWHYGYGYQIWLLKDGAFAFRGMGAQFAVCVPDKDFLFVCTGDIQGCDKHDYIIFNALWNEIINDMGGSLPENIDSYEKLTARCENLSLLPIRGESEGKVLEEINGKTYVLDKNPMEITKLRVDINGDEGVLSYTNPRGDKKIYFGIKKYVEAGFPEEHYFGDTINKPLGRMYQAASCAAWTEEDKLVIRTFIIDDYFGNLTVTLSFKGDIIGVYMHKTAEFFLNEYQGFAGGRKL